MGSSHHESGDERNEMNQGAKRMYPPDEQQSVLPSPTPESRGARRFVVESPPDLSPDQEVTIDLLLERATPESRETIRQAYDLADQLHEGQLRSSGEPYIKHPLYVAWYLVNLKMDSDTIVAGLLHDSLEDTHVSEEELSHKFPESAVKIVKGVTKISKMSFQTSRDAQVENLRLMLLAMAKDIRVVVVKLCDRLHNMQTLRFLPSEKRIKISRETLDIYAPLANRLGMSGIKSQLEDLSMRWLFPEEYAVLAEKISVKREERERVVAKTIEVLYEHLTPEYPDIIITGRPKHFYSIHKKMTRQGLSFEQIYDLNAIRVITEHKDDCYNILGLIHALWKPLPHRFHDYIGMPKKNMYRSIHTTVIGQEGVVTEIQIRTRDMHQVAELGIAAHWHYKEKGSEIQNDERLSWLRQLAEWIIDPSEQEGLMEALKTDVFADRVLCFTPAGDVIELPAEATPIDFAYAIHSKVGEQCVGANINGRMVNLRTHLSHGDVVEIITATNGHPSRDWLQYVRTARASQKIKHWFKARNVDEYVEDGRRGLLRLLKERGVVINQHELESKLDELAKEYKLGSGRDLLVEIGFGSISAQAAIARMNPEWARSRRKPKTTSQTATPKKTKWDSSVVHVEGAEGVPFKLANCCKPIPGDEIIGYITKGRGISIHNVDCASVIRMKKSEQERSRLFRAHWGENVEGHYPVTLRIEAEDYSGLLNNISGVISSMNLFIHKSQTVSNFKKATAVLWFDVHVRDHEQLAKVLASIRREKGVISAERRRNSPA